MNRTAVRTVEKRARRSNNTAHLEQMGAHYMAALPADLRPSVPKTRSMESYIKSFITARNDVQQVYAQKIQSRGVLALDNPLPAPRPARDRAEKKRPRVRAAKNSSTITWSLCTQLHALWSSYMRDLLGERVHEQEFMNKVLKADLHGCVLKVTQARNVSQIGVQGLVLSEGERTFQLAVLEGREGTVGEGEVSEDYRLSINSSALSINSSALSINSSDKPRIMTVSKCHTVFVFQWADRLITIYGNHFIQRSADRSAKKFKGKDTIEL